MQIATFGLSVVAGNWVVTLLEHEGHGRSISGVVGGLVLFAGVVTRPAGGLVVRRDRGSAWPLVAVSLVVGSAGVLVLAAAPPLWLAALAALAVGLAAGFPFAAVFDMTLRLRPDAPAAAVGLRQRLRRARDPRLHAARRPHVQPARRRPARLPRDRPRWAAALLAVGRASQRCEIIGSSESDSHKERNMALSFGVTVLPDPPYQRLVELMVLGEQHGFEIGWTYDSHVLWQDSFPLLTLAAQATTTMKFGHQVTNPGTREPTVRREPVRDAARHLRRAHGDGHRPRRLGGALHRPAARASVAEFERRSR